VYAAALARQQPRLLAAADRVVVLSAATRAVFGELGLPLERCDVIANPLPDEAFASESKADRGTYALCAGRLVEEKGFDVAVRAAREAGVPLRIAGGGPEWERLRALGGEVELLGQVTPARMAALLAGAAVLLAPSRCEEQSPYAVLEAMAAGVPVIASSLGGLPELAGADSTLDSHDVAGWTAALGALWADAGARRERGEAALARARDRASGDAVYDALTGVYARAGASVA
jgi:glycosyltransferase involved in cell wall biosynthesis